MLYHNTSQPVGTSNRIDLANVTNYSFSGLDPSKTYYYSVVGYNKTGPSSMSAAAGATPIPKAPASITATLGAGSNTITWPSTNGATGGYTLYYSTSTPVTTSDNAFAVSGTSYTHTGLAGGTPIYYAVSAYNAGGHSPLSSETSSLPNPATPTGIAAVAGTEENVISWNSVAGATGYTLHYSESTPVTTGDPFFTVSGNNYTHTSLDAAKTYYYAVIANGSTGSSPLSGEASAQPIPAVPTMTVGTSTDSSVTVTWNTVSGASYKIYSSTTSPVSTSDNQTITTGNSHTVSGLTTGDTLYFAMISENSIGQSSGVLSNEVSAMAVPLAPRTLVATPDPDGKKINLSWGTTPGANGYKVYLKTGTHSAVSTSDSLVKDTTSTIATITALNIGEKGTFGVLAYNAGGNSGWSNIEVVQPLPRQPTISTPIDVSQPGKATFTWNNNNGVDTFNIYRVLSSTSPNPEIDGALIATVSGSVTTYTDSGFPNYNVAYTYAVIGNNASGSSKVSNKPTAIPVDPAWQTVTMEGLMSYEPQVAGTADGSAFVLSKIEGSDATMPLADTGKHKRMRLTKYNAVAEVVYDMPITTGTAWDIVPIDIQITPDDNLTVMWLTNNVDQADIATSSSTQYGMVVAKIDADDGSFIWRKWYDPYNSTFPGQSEIGEMALNSNGDVYLTYADSDGANVTKLSGTDGSLVTSFGTGGSYDRQSDTSWMRTGTSATYGYGNKFGSEIVVLPDDSVFMLHPTDEGVYGTKWDSSDNIIFANRYLDIDRTSSNPWSYRASNSLVADKVGNIFYAQRYNSSTQHIHKFNADGTWIKSVKSPYLGSLYLDKIATNGEDIILVPRSEQFVNELDNELVFKQRYVVFSNRPMIEMDFYVAKDSCFRFGAHAKHSAGSIYHQLGTPWGGSNSEKIGNTSSTAPNNVFIWRTDDNNVLNATSSTCPSSTGLMSATTPVSITGNGSELGYYVYSGMNGEGDWRMKYSSSSTPVQHSVPGVGPMDYGTSHECRIVGTDVQCKGSNGYGQLGNGTTTSSTSAFVTVDNTDLSSAKDVSVGSDFTCALDGTGSPWCWGRGKKGRLGNGIGSNPDKATPYAVSTTTVFISIESGKAHTCALTSTGAIECWGDNTLGQMAEDPSTQLSRKSPKIPGDITDEFAGIVFSKVSIGAESDFTAALLDNGSIAAWGTYNGVQYNDHFVVNSGLATDVAAGKDHICYLEGGVVTCVGNNSAGQTTVPTLTNPTSVHAGADWSCAVMADTTYTCWGSKNGWEGY